MFREGLAGVLTSTPDLDVVGTACTLEDAADRCEVLRPDAVVFDVDTAMTSPCRATSRLRRASPEALIVAIHRGVLHRAQVRELRASSVHLVDCKDGVGRVITAIRAAGSGRTVLVPFARPSPERVSRLSPRELSVLTLVAAGCTTVEISRHLGVSPNTVENHKRRMFLKLGVQNQAHALSIAIDQAWIEPRRALAIAAGD